MQLAGGVAAALSWITSVLIPGEAEADAHSYDRDATVTLPGRDADATVPDRTANLKVREAERT